MKAKLIDKFSYNDVRSYWRQINAPVYLRKCPSQDGVYSVLLAPGCNRAAANAFIIASADMNELSRDVITRKLGAKSPVLDPVVVLEHIWGKTL